MLINVLATDIEKIKKNIKDGKKLTKAQWKIFAAEGDLREVVRLLAVNAGLSD